MKNVYLLILFVISFSYLNFAQASDVKVESGVFTRKSITIIPLTTRSLTSYFNTMLDVSLDLANTSRNDYNRIKASTVRQAQESFADNSLDYSFPQDKNNLAKLKKVLIESGALKEIINSTGNLDSLNARNLRSQKRIVTTSANQMGIQKPTVNEMMTLMNGTLIGIPILRDISSKESEVFAQGQLYWLQLDVSKVSNWDDQTNLPDFNQVELSIVKTDNNKVSVNPKTKSNNASSLLLNSVTSIYEDEPESDFEMPIEKRAARQFVRSILKQAKVMDEFKLRGTIQDVTDGIRLDVGKREAAYLDQGYKVYELRMGENNKKYSVYTGFIRLNSVANNVSKVDALSSAYPILGSYGQGYTVTSHDQSFDLIITPNYRLINVPRELIGTTDDIKSSFNGNVSLLYNTARVTNVTQLFIGASFGLGYLNGTPDAGYYSSDSKLLTLTMDYSLLIMKKFWLNNLNLSIGAEAGYVTLNSNAKNDNGMEYNVATGSLAFGGNIGIQIPFSADLIIGVHAGYKYALAPSSIKIKSNGVETEYKKDDYPLMWEYYKINDVNLGGAVIGLDVSYSLSAF